MSENLSAQNRLGSLLNQLPFFLVDESGCLTQEAIDQLGDGAEKLFLLQQRIVERPHANFPRELTKVEQLLNHLGLLGQSLNRPTIQEVLSNTFDLRQPWSSRNELAESRLPVTGGLFSQSLRGRDIHRGPNRYRGVK